MIEHALSCHLQHGLGGRCTCGASEQEWAEQRRLADAALRLGQRPPMPVTPTTYPAEIMGDLVEDAVRRLVSEDQRMRAEVLPAAPEGYAWDVGTETTERPDGVVGEIRIRLVYRLVQVAS